MVDVMRSLMLKLSYITKNFIRIRKTLQDLSLWDSESYGQRDDPRFLAMTAFGIMKTGIYLLVRTLFGYVSM